MPEIGFEISGTDITTATIRPDNDFSRNYKPNVRVAEFGNGYQQRAKPGINNIVETFAMQFKNREKSAADDIIKFFNDKAGVTSFNVTVPDDNSTSTDQYGNKVSTIKVICESWSQQYNNANHYNVNANFKRLYV